MCDNFYERYKSELSDYDAFIVTHTPVLSLLYEKFNKPVITVASTRYEAPFSNDVNRWNWLNQKLVSMIDNGQITPIANNKYDKFYCEYFTDREWQHIPSICDYTKTKYKCRRNEHILFGRNARGGSFRPVGSLGKYRWDDLYSYKSIIHVPYNVSIMSIFEQYTANVPMFFPSLNSVIKMSPRRSPRNQYLSELFYFPNMITSSQRKDLIRKEVLGLADFYDDEWMPFVLFYDNWSHLNKEVHNQDFKNISKNMEEFNVLRQKRIYELWDKLFQTFFSSPPNDNVKFM